MRVFFNPIALRKAKITYNFGLSECNKVKPVVHGVYFCTETSYKSYFLPVRPGISPQFFPLIG